VGRPSCALGVFAPRAEQALSGGGWEADGSESVRARELIDRHFAGHGSYALAVVVSSPRYTVGDPPFRRAVERTGRALGHEAAVANVRLPRRGGSISADGHVAVVRGGAGADTAEMVRTAGRVHDELGGLAPVGVEVAVTGSPALWSSSTRRTRPRCCAPR
jgi:putative drug exporter of the RND superfamily